VQNKLTSGLWWSSTAGLPSTRSGRRGRRVIRHCRAGLTRDGKTYRWFGISFRVAEIAFHFTEQKNQTACMRICLNLFFHFSSHFLHLFFNFHLSSFIDFPFLHFFTTILHPILWWESLPFLTFPFSASSQHVTILNPGYELHATV
jgi:hypothetical protein